jgi:hypothetical protein
LMDIDRLSFGVLGMPFSPAAQLSTSLLNLPSLTTDAYCTDKIGLIN